MKLIQLNFEGQKNIMIWKFQFFKGDFEFGFERFEGNFDQIIKWQLQLGWLWINKWADRYE